MIDMGAGGAYMEGKTTLGVIGVMALVLWVVTIAALGWFFVNGWTKPAADGRTDQRSGIRSLPRCGNS